MDHMNGTELHEWAHEDHGNVDPAHNGIDTRRDPTERALIENGRIRDKVHAELAAHAREFQRVFMAYRLLVPRPSLQKLAEWNADEQYGHEWRLNAARTDEELIAVYQAQLANYAVTKERLATERILLDDARREIAALRAENATLCEKLDAANAKLAALENAALVAEQDVKDVCAGFSAAHWYREVTALRNENDQMRKQLGIPTSADLVVRAGKRVYPLASQADAHEDDDDATPATLGDRRQQETRSIEWTPPTRSKPDAVA